MIVPEPPRADFSLPWDSTDVDDPVVALGAARAAPRRHVHVSSGGVTYLFTFSEEGLRSFYAVEERDASKGIADYRMLVRKLPDELFAERRTFAHDLFGADEMQGYLDNLDWAIGDRDRRSWATSGSFDVFDFARRLGHRLGLACWIGREAPIDRARPRVRDPRRCRGVRAPGAVARRDEGRRAGRAACASRPSSARS